MKTKDFANEHKNHRPEKSDDSFYILVGVGD